MSRQRKGEASKGRTKVQARISMQIDMPFEPEDEKTRRALQPCTRQHQPPVKCFGVIERPETDGVTATVHYVDDPARLKKLVDLLVGVLDDARARPDDSRRG
jgi:hypothetical protein